MSTHEHEGITTEEGIKAEVIAQMSATGPVMHAQAQEVVGGIHDPAQAAKQPTKRRRQWSESERHQHKVACAGKSKLTFGQRLEIIRRHESKEPEYRLTQSQLAEQFGKSRSAISKILRPDTVERIKATAATGIDQDVKRYFPPEHPALEKKLYQYIENSRRESNDPTKPRGGGVDMTTICKNAEQFAREMGIQDFRSSSGWYARFAKRYGLVMSTGDQLADGRDDGSRSMPMGDGGGPLLSAPYAHGGRIKINANVKVTLRTLDGVEVVRRRIGFNHEVDHTGIPIGGYETMMSSLRGIFKAELGPILHARLSYKDEDGDDIIVSSDAELAIALQHRVGGDTVRFILTPIK